MILSKGRAMRAAALLAAAVAGTALGMAPQASADTAATPQSRFDVAYVHGGALQVWGCTWPDPATGGLGGCGPVLANGPAVAPNSSPSIMQVGTNGYEVAYQAANHDLSVIGSLGTGDLGLGMMPRTSPAITGVKGSYDIAFQANTGTLWTTGESGTANWNRAMDPLSSPSIMTVQPYFTITHYGFETAIEDRSDDLENYGWSNGIYTSDKMEPATNPSISTDPVTGGYDIAFQGACPQPVLNEVIGSGPNQPTSCAGEGVSPGSSPSLSNTPPNPTNPSGGMELGFNALDGRLFGLGAVLAGPVQDPRSPNGINILPGSSPMVVGTVLPSYLGAGTASGFEFFYTDLSGELRYVLGSAFSSAYLNPASPVGAIDQGTNPSVISFQ